MVQHVLSKSLFGEAPLEIPLDMENVERVVSNSSTKLEIVYKMLQLIYFMRSSDNNGVHYLFLLRSPKIEVKRFEGFHLRWIIFGFVRERFHQCISIRVEKIFRRKLQSTEW